jgi:PAS domain S-box-containing protein
VAPSEPDKPERLFETIVEAANAAGVGISVFVDEGDGPKFVYVNARSAEMNGLPAEELVGKSVRVSVAPEDMPLALRLQEDRMHGPVPIPPRRVELTLLRPDGSRLPIEMGLSWASYGGRLAGVAFLHDTSERRRALEALSRSEASFRQLIEAAPDAISVVRDGLLVYANPAYVALFGFSSAAEMVGRKLEELVHPDDRQRLRGRLKLRQEGAHGDPVEYRVVRRGGELRIVEVVGIGIEFEGAPSVLAFARDVTERNRIRAELMEADRLAAMGRMAAGVGHEINNPLAYVLLNLQMLEQQIERWGPTDRLADARDALRNALVGVDRVRTIARDLKSFSRLDPDTRRPVDVRHVVESAINMALHEIRLHGRLVTRFDEVPPVLANEARLGQVVLNLLVNAAQALSDRPSDHNEVRVSVGPVDGDRVVIEVADTGPGIAPEILGRIFEPYFTTKPIDVGTGLGLSIGRSIVTGLGGTLTATNLPVGGASFRIVLPGITSDVGRSAMPAPVSGRGRRLRVLIVEDEPALALAIQRALSERHEAMVAPGGREALDLLKRDEAFDVVLCDLMMPGMSGMELFESVRTRDSNLVGHFIFMTGGAPPPHIRDFVASTGRAWLEKPFDMVALLAFLDSSTRDSDPAGLQPAGS